MSIENVKKFYEAVSKDASLKQKFVELSQKYQGQPMDEEKAMALMEQEVLPLTVKLGYTFTVDDLKAYSEEMKQAGMNRELSDEELQAVVGGNTFTGFCLLVGYIHVDNGRGYTFDGWCNGGLCVGPGIIF
jgi:bacteriocin-like protein